MPDITPTTPTVPIVGQTTPQQQQQQKQPQPKQQPIFRRVYHKTLQKGSLVTFNYLFWKHDPYPLVLCSGIYHDGKIGGINLHYLTFRYVKYLVQQYCEKQFSYSLIKNNSYISNAFRTYKRTGVRTSKLLDCDFLMTLLGKARSFNPNEIEAMRQQIQKQLRERVNPKADDLTNEYSGTISPTDERYKDVSGFKSNKPLQSGKQTVDDARKNPNL